MAPELSTAEQRQSPVRKRGLLFVGLRLADEFSAISVPLRFPRGIPNIEPRDDIKITDRAPIILPDGDGGARMEVMRWSWPSPQGVPVFNFRSEGRRFGRDRRCLIPADGFYEFTASDDPKTKRKAKWLFTMKDRELFGIVGTWRAGSANGEDAWTMLTCAPGLSSGITTLRACLRFCEPRWCTRADVFSTSASMMSSKAIIRSPS
jgi:hypothetical protein